MNTPGKYIVFEGVDMSGKTTMSQRLEAWLHERDVDAVLTIHPGATPLGAKLRQIVKQDVDIDPVAQALLFAADNVSFCNQILRPALADGQWVIADRNNFISSLAYQIAEGCSLEDLDRIHATISNPPKIDLLIVFTLSWDEIKRRRENDQRPKDRWDHRGKDYVDNLSDSYKNLIEKNSGRLRKFVHTTEDLSNGAASIQVPRCIFIDASQPVDVVFDSVVEVVSTML